MPDAAELTVFLAASTALILVPGPNLIYIVTQSMSRGTRAGLASAVGVETGTLVYVVATAVGVSGLIARSDAAFAVLTWAGAGYLLYLAGRVLRNPPTIALPGASAGHSPWRAWREGAVINLLNPKVGLFFLAFLPQFVDTSPRAAPTPAQLTVLGLLFLTIAFLLDLGYALAGGAAAAAIRRRGQFLTWLRWPIACVYLALASYAVLA